MIKKEIPEFIGKPFTVSPEAQEKIKNIDPKLSPTERLKLAIEIARGSK